MRKLYFLTDVFAVNYFYQLTDYPCLVDQMYELSWTHGMCLGDSTSILTLPRDTSGYRAVTSILLIIRYILPVIICILSICKYAYSQRVTLSLSLFLSLCVSLFLFLSLSLCLSHRIVHSGNSRMVEHSTIVRDNFIVPFIVVI